MKKLALHIVCCMIVFITLSFQPANTNQDNIDRVLNALNKYSDGITLKSGEEAHIKIQMSFQSPEKFGGKSHSLNCESYTDGERSYFVSDEIEVYQDLKSTVTVLPSDRKIYVYGSGRTNLDRIQSSLVTQKYIMECVTESSSSQVILDGVSCFKVNLKLDDKAKKKYAMESAVFWISTESGELKQSVMYQTDDQPTKSLQCKFISNEKGKLNLDILRNKPIEIVMKGSSLKEKYSHFKLVDYRK
jgi:hypothetical protein